MKNWFQGFSGSLVGAAMVMGLTLLAIAGYGQWDLARTKPATEVNRTMARAFETYIPIVQSDRCEWPTDVPFKVVYLDTKRTVAIYQTPDDNLFETRDPNVLKLYWLDYFIFNETTFPGPKGFMKIPREAIDFTKTDYNTACQ